MPAPKPLIIDATKEEDMLKIYPQNSLLSSNNLNWDGIHLGYYRLPPHSIPENSRQQNLIVISPKIPPGIKIEQKFDGQFRSGQINDGDITIVPANMPHQASWNQEHSYILISLDRDKLASFAPLTDLDAVELIPCFHKADPLILGIGLALKTEIESNNSGGHLYIDSLTATLSAHLLRHYSTRKFTIPENRQGLPQYKLRQVISYINDQIDRNFTLAELAALVNMSPSYFSSLFKISMGCAPHQYLIRRRVDRAKILLREGKLTIAEIAHSLGFAHQSHLNRHFKRLVGITPKIFQKQK